MTCEMTGGLQLPAGQSRYYESRLMNNKKYNSVPVDTSDVVLPEELQALKEKIAENVHDVWAVGRMAEGWVYGPVKDLEKKTTPQLVA